MENGAQVFSLSEKYAEWKRYAEPATGYGIHNYILQQTKPIRLTQAQLETHPEWKAFGTEKANHPPMNGWLATPLLDAAGKNWGLIQLSDKVDGDYDEEDEAMLLRFANLLATALELAWEKRNWQKEKNA